MAAIVETIHRKVFWYWFLAVLFVAESAVFWPFFFSLNQKMKGSSFAGVLIAFMVASLAKSLAKRNLWNALRIAQQGRKLLLVSGGVLFVVAMSNI